MNDKEIDAITNLYGAIDPELNINTGDLEIETISTIIDILEKQRKEIERLESIINKTKEELISANNMIDDLLCDVEKD